MEEIDTTLQVCSPRQSIRKLPIKNGYDEEQVCQNKVKTNEKINLLFFLQGVSFQEQNYAASYYDKVDKSDPYSTILIPKVNTKEISKVGTLILVIISMILVVVTLPFSLCYCVKVVQEYERAVIFRLGRLKKGGASGPGLFFILPCIDKYSCLDLRTVSYEVPPQEMLSRDSVTVSVDAVCFYKVSQHNSSSTLTFSSKYLPFSDFQPTRCCLQCRLILTFDKSACGDEFTKRSGNKGKLGQQENQSIPTLQTLAEILSEREMMGQLMQNILDDATRPWGVKVERVEIKVRLTYLVDHQIV